jgi:hypothetical protein
VSSALGALSRMNSGVSPRRLYERKPDGSYVCRADASPVWIRCIARHKGWFEHVDGWDEVHRYRLVPLSRTPPAERNTSPRPRERFRRIPRHLRILGWPP